MAKVKARTKQAPKEMLASETWLECISQRHFPASPTPESWFGEVGSWPVDKKARYGLIPATSGEPQHASSNGSRPPFRLGVVQSCFAAAAASTTVLPQYRVLRWQMTLCWTWIQSTPGILELNVLGRKGGETGKTDLEPIVSGFSTVALKIDLHSNLIELDASPSLSLAESVDLSSAYSNHRLSDFSATAQPRQPHLPQHSILDGEFGMHGKQLSQVKESILSYRNHVCFAWQ